MSDFRGAAREMAGRVQEKVGEFTGDTTKTQAEGLYNQAAGQAQQQVARLGSRVSFEQEWAPLTRRRLVCTDG